jgi:PAS domain S-box-containing protein
MSVRRRLIKLSTLSGLLAQAVRPTDVLPAAIEVVADVMDVDVVLIYSLAPDGGELLLSAHRGVSEEFAAGVDRMKLGEGFNGRVAQTGESMIVSDATQDPRLSREIVRHENIRTQLVVPMKSGGEVVGTICVAMRREREFDVGEMELLGAIGSQIGITLDKADLFEKQVSMTEQLRRSEAKYRDLFQNASDAILIHDLDGAITDLNRACERLLGYSKAELLGRRAAEFLKEGALDLARDVRDKLVSGEASEQRYEQSLVRREGGEAIVEVATTLITSDGKPVGFQNIARDVTEQRKMRDNLSYYLRQVLLAQEEERKRISRELHDDTSQSLLLLIHWLDALISGPRDGLSKQAWGQAAQLRTLAVDILEGVRRYAQELRPAILDDLGLVAAMEWMAESLDRERGINVGVEVKGSDCEFSPEAKLVLFRIAQEALSNVKRHSEATRASVKLDCRGERISMTVSDNGKGFDLLPRLGDWARSGKLGLTGMRERATLLGGTLRVESKPGEGTTVTIELPQTAA